MGYSPQDCKESDMTERLPFLPPFLPSFLPSFLLSFRGDGGRYVW